MSFFEPCRNRRHNLTIWLSFFMCMFTYIFIHIHVIFTMTSCRIYMYIYIQRYPEKLVALSQPLSVCLSLSLSLSFLEHCETEWPEWWVPIAFTMIPLLRPAGVPSPPFSLWCLGQSRTHYCCLLTGIVDSVTVHKNINMFSYIIFMCIYSICLHIYVHL